MRPPAHLPIVPPLPIIRTLTEGEQRATFFELFFDLVYVFAVTQLSHHLLADITWSGAAETAFMLVALYWAWNYTTWMTNWFDPDTVPVRLVLVFVMLASLLMAIAIPKGSAMTRCCSRAPTRACRSGETAFVVAVTPRGAFNQNFRQILAWSLLSAPLWVAGGIVDPRHCAGCYGWVPSVWTWLRRWPPTGCLGWQHADEPVADRGAHFGERFQLFVIIALGRASCWRALPPQTRA